MPLIVWEIEESRLARASLPAIDRMTGHDFERWLTLFFRSKGYHATRTPDQGDWGAHVILKAPDGRRIAVQAKRWRGRVGVEAVQQVVAARAHYSDRRWGWGYVDCNAWLQVADSDDEVPTEPESSAGAPSDSGSVRWRLSINGSQVPKVGHEISRLASIPRDRAVAGQPT